MRILSLVFVLGKESVAGPLNLIVSSLTLPWNQSEVAGWEIKIKVCVDGESLNQGPVGEVVKVFHVVHQPSRLYHFWAKFTLEK